MAETSLPEEVPRNLGPYCVDELLGKGGMGEVYRGRDTENDRAVALKRIKKTDIVTDEDKGRFRREARALQRVHHASVVEIYDQIEHEGEDWLVMELVEGSSLDKLLKEGPLPPRRAVEIVRDLAAGLRAIHDEGIVHRDLKPANVILPGAEDADSLVKILDFGLAKRISSTDGETVTATISQKGQILGTIRYMAPEQALGRKLDQRSDLFSLGVIFYEMVAGAPPFAGANDVETLTRLCTERETPVERRQESVPAPLARLIAWMLEKEPLHRPQSAEEVERILGELAEGMAEGRSETTLLNLLPDDTDPASGDIETAAYSQQLTVDALAGLAALDGSHVRTLLLNDLVDSTKLVEKLGDERAAEIFAEHDRLARLLLKNTNGREIDKSDGFLMLFERPIDAVRFGLRYHDALEQLSKDEGVEVSSRVGIHVGEVVLRTNSPEDVLAGAKPLEVEGLAKAMAARFMSLAGARQTLVSRGVFDLAKRSAVGAKDLPEDLQWMDHGRYRMKGVEEPVEVFEIGSANVAPLSAPADTKKVKRVREVSGRLSGWKLRGATAALMVLMVLAGLGVWQVWQLREVPDPTYVVVPQPEIIASTQEMTQELAVESGAVHAGVLRALLSLSGVAPIEPTSRDTGIDSPMALSQALGADEVLVSTLDCDSRSCQVILKRIQGADGQVLWNGRFTGKIENLLDLSLAVEDQVRGSFPDVDVREGLAQLRVSSEDYEEFLRLKKRYWSREEAGVVDEVLESLKQLRESSPEFLEAYTFEVTILAGRFGETRQEGDYQRAVDIVEKGRDLAPVDPRIIKAATRIYLESGRLDEAEAELEKLGRWDPGDADLLELQARVLRRRGQLDEARSLMEDVVARRPAWNYYASFANLEKEAGDSEATHRHLQEMLARAPEHRYSQALLAQFELLSGSVERAVELYEAIAHRSPEATELTNLGVAYFLVGRYSDAARTYKRALELTPDSPVALLNLADSELLAGNQAVATKLYERLFEKVSADPNLDDLLTIQAQALAHLDRTEEAVDAIQKALRAAPDDPLVAFEAAVVYLVVGEETSALLHARRALDAGLDLVWFDFVWFDPIRERLLKPEADS